MEEEGAAIRFSRGPRRALVGPVRAAWKISEWGLQPKKPESGGKWNRWGSGAEVGGQSFSGHGTSCGAIPLSLLARWHFGPQFPHQCFRAGLGERGKLRQEGQRGCWVLVGQAGWSPVAWSQAWSEECWIRGRLLGVMDYDGLFGREAALSDGLSSLEVEMPCLTCQSASPPPQWLTSLPSHPTFAVPDLSGRSSVNGRGREEVSKGCTEHWRPSIWCISCSASLFAE